MKLEIVCRSSRYCWLLLLSEFPLGLQWKCSHFHLYSSCQLFASLLSLSGLFAAEAPQSWSKWYCSTRHATLHPPSWITCLRGVVLDFAEAISLWSTSTWCYCYPWHAEGPYFAYDLDCLLAEGHSSPKSKLPWSWSYSWDWEACVDPQIFALNSRWHHLIQSCDQNRWLGSGKEGSARVDQMAGVEQESRGRFSRCQHLSQSSDASPWNSASGSFYLQTSFLLLHGAWW